MLTAFYMPGTITDPGNAIGNKTGKFLALIKFALKSSIVKNDGEKQFYDVSSVSFLSLVHIHFPNQQIFHQSSHQKLPRATLQVCRSGLRSHINTVFLFSLLSSMK